MKKITVTILSITILIILLLGGGWLVLSTIGEGEKPAIAFNEELRSLGREKVLTITFADRKSGLRTIAVAINQDKISHPLVATSFPAKGVTEQTLSVTIKPVELKLHEGIASLTVSAVDYSLRKNETLINRPIAVDFTPPQIFLLTPTNNINPGGCCVVAFRTSEPAIAAGVQVNNTVSYGYPVIVAGKQTIITYFGIPLDAKKGETIMKAFARDAADNEATLTLPSLIRGKKFRSDKMKLADTFLNQKMTDFQPIPPELQGKSPLELFAYVNGPMRLANETTIRDLCKKSSPNQLWEGTFLRMKDASPMAQFGDKRTYLYGNKGIGESVHLGVDLASLAHAPVAASNNGIVTFTGNLGIYGNAILLDHGLGIFSLYGHLSVITAKAGQQIKKGDIIGNTGMTGLAAGDHLHFSMLAGRQFINPVEWWDQHWITDNITDKIAQLN